MHSANNVLRGTEQNENCYVESGEESMSASPPVDSHQLIMGSSDALKIAHKFLVMSPTDYDRMTTEVRKPRQLVESARNFSMNEGDDAESDSNERFEMKRQSF